MRNVPGYLLMSLGALSLTLSARKFVMFNGGTLVVHRFTAALVGLAAIGVGILIVRS